MEQCKIDKINELARKARSCELTAEEMTLQSTLREEYVAAIRTSLKNKLDHTTIEYPDGTRKKLKQRE